MTARWRGHSHPELYTMINSGPGAAASDPQTQYWNSLTEELGHIDADLNKALTELKATWQGGASDSANTGMTPLQAWASDAQTGSTVMGVSTQDQADFISKARAEMPPPVEVTTPAPSAWDVVTAGAAMLTGDPGPAAAVANQANDHEHQEHAQDAAAQKAVDTMNTYESNSTWNRNTLGTFVPPPDVVVSTPPPAGMTSGGVVGGWSSTAGSYQGGSQRTTSSHVTAPPSTGDGGYRPPLPVGSGNGSVPPGGQGPGGGYTPPGTTTPAGFPPVGAGDTDTLPHRPGTGPGFPGGPGLPGFPGGSDPETLAGGRGLTGVGGLGPEGGRGGTGGFGPGGGGSGADAGRPASQLGRGGAGGLGAAGGEGGVFGRGGAGAAGGAGTRGGALGGPMGAGGHGEGDEDQEHFSPDYLMETNDVFGDDRMVSPAVIGENPMPEEQ